MQVMYSPVPNFLHLKNAGPEFSGLRSLKGQILAAENNFLLKNSLYVIYLKFFLKTHKLICDFSVT